MANYCGCGSLKYGSKCTNKNCPERGTKRKGWLVNGILYCFGTPVTFEEASRAAVRISELQEEIRIELRK